jgi:hypothetical protein
MLHPNVSHIGSSIDSVPSRLAREIHAFQGPKAGHISSQFTSPSKLSVLTADRPQYEALILDFVEKGA